MAQAIVAAAICLSLTIAYTWPLAAGIASDVPWDLGDPLLNIWILGWAAEPVLRGLAGDLQAVAGFWDATSSTRSR